VVLDVADVVAVDLGDVHEPDPAVPELEECPVGGDALDGPLHDRSDL